MKKTFILILALILVFLTACSQNEDENIAELKSLEVDFDVQETARVGEEIALKATVTYGDEMVEDADEVSFEYWEEEKEDDSTTIESINNGDGTYTVEVTFEDAGVYSIYAHTTARGLHTMPKKTIIVEEDKGEE